MKNNMNRNIKNVLVVLAFPIVVGCIMEVFSLLLSGTHLITSVLDVKNLIRSSGMAACIALALSFNIPSGRFDLSLGAQKTVAVIIGGNIALALGFGGIGVLVFSVLFGILFGLLVGGIFVTLRIPPMVLGVGMALLLECISFTAFNSQGLGIYGEDGVGILSNMGFVIVIVIVAVIISIIVTRYTIFGYHQRAINGSQKIARNSGINVFINAVICYTMAGALVSISGVFEAAYKGNMEASLGLTSVGSVMANTFPMFLGGYIGRWCNQPIGIVVGCITIKLFTAGQSAFNLTTTASELVNIITFLLFLVFLANQNYFKDKKKEQERIKEAKAMRSQLGL